jgi:hypothetical protein
MSAVVQEFVQPGQGVGDGVGRDDTEGIEAEPACFARDRVAQIGGPAQKSRST